MRWIWVIALVSACGKSDAPAPATGSGAASGSAPGSGSAVAAVGSGSAAGSGSGSGSAAAAPPLSPKIKAARCGEPCLFLVDTPLAKMTETFTSECAGMKTPDLGYSDCKQLDYVRNCIYAAHGVVFKKKRWKVFATKPWYEPHPEADPKTILGAAELANVHELNSRGKACKKGMTISGADYDRVKAWFADVAKAPMPKLIFKDTSFDLSETLEPMSAKDFRAWLAENEPKAKSRFKKDNLVTANYEGAEDELSKKLVATIKPADPKKIRIVRIDFDSGESGSEENPWTAGTVVKLVYDDKDQLVALEGARYGID